MKKIIIVGAGGLGRQSLAQLQTDYAHGIDWVIAGFLDERGPSTVSDDLFYPWLGHPESFEPRSEYLFVAAIGDPASRERQVVQLAEKGAEFISVRTRCQIGVRTQYGPTFFAYNVCTGVDCRIGAYCYVDQDALLGHDVVLGDYAHVGARCLLAGYVKVGKGVVIHSGAMISRGVTIGDGAVVGMGAVVFKDVPPGATVLGNPARVTFQR
ncbi:acetyltransferase [Pseudomonas sp. CDFA 602]|uniref:acetyltransferase n=1 Tax=Pseudomonas californiensis TaxID=2829823 RepID=UPI001E2FD218|nr:acetyltransferase [Pseudomonas californiensis]MCD5996853.1 acetyltransferase [Pseudomonas californiensis]MCD5998328.1 acetyltransferase [Pseudomonas californiensis]